MNRQQFRTMFGASGPVVLPVIHVLDNQQAETNVQTAIAGGCPGVFLINHDFPYPAFLPIIHHIRARFPDLWLGVNFLAITGKDAFPVLGNLQRDEVQIDGYWADDACIDERREADDQPEASEIDSIRKSAGWDGLYFGGTAFKKQREVNSRDHAVSATIACRHMDVVTTSGVATGHSADLGKINTFREACKDNAIALASGITPENAHEYADLVDCFMVATGINIANDFYNIDATRLANLMEVAQNLEKSK